MEDIRPQMRKELLSLPRTQLHGRADGHDGRTAGSEL